jgi:hypothetical protein
MIQCWPGSKKAIADSIKVTVKDQLDDRRATGSAAGKIRPLAGYSGLSGKA